MSTPYSNEILISIRPKYVDLIRSGQKKDEIRKTRPARLSVTSFYRVYIYQTGGGGVVGTFVLRDVTYVQAYVDTDGVRRLTNTTFLQHCLDDSELFEYLYNESGRKSSGWAWHISELQMFEKAMKLEQFGLKRPPQSWCYLWR